MIRKMQSTIGVAAACALGFLVTSTMADTPVLSGDYSWEDGTGTILGSFGSLVDPINTGPVDGVVPHTGNRMLRVTKADGSASAPQAYVAFIENLQDGDVVTAGAYIFDDIPGTSYRARVWAHYAQSGDPNSFAGSAGGPSTYTSGIGWQLSSHSWEFDSNGGTRDALMIEVRLYTSADNTPFYIDDVFVDVYCAANEDLTITFADWAAIGDPLPPGPECEPGKPCVPEPLGSYGWEDEVGTAFNTTGNITQIENTGTFGDVSPNSGERMLRVRQGSPTGTPQVWIAFVENLQDGDEIFASFHGYDDTAGVNPRLRIWGHYAVSGDPMSNAGSAGGNNTYSSGIGWEEIGHTWTFDSNGGARDALMIEARLYAPTGEEDTDFFLDDIYVEVCSDNPNVTVTFPADAPGPADPCDLPKGTPTLFGDFDWEDGESTILGYDNDEQENITAANIGAPEPVNSGSRALRVTEAPHGDGTPKVFLAYIEHLQDGDVIHGRFHAFDDTPGTNPSVRIWGRRVYSGSIDGQNWSAGGNEQFTSGTGWEEICHTWVYNGGSQNTDALVIEARIYSPSDCEVDCSTDYYIDDMEIHLWANANATITLPDGSVIGEPPLICPADINGSGDVGTFDLFTVLGAWGTSDPQADINNDGLVDGADLGILLASWGPCAVPYLAPAEGEVDLVVDTTALRSGMNRHDIYVQLHDADDTLVNVYDANVNFSGSFDSSSYIAIGEEHVSVIPDPNFDTFEFAFGIGMGLNAGWYNEDPPNEIGRAGLYAGNQVLILSLTMDENDNAEGTLSVTYEDAEGRPIYATASFDTADVGSPCVGDINGDGVVDVSDLLAMLGAWGSCPGCAADLNGDGVVDVSDLLMLLGAWGSCPR